MVPQANTLFVALGLCCIAASVSAQQNYNAPPPVQTLQCYSGVGYARVQNTCSANEKVCKKWDVKVLPAIHSCSSDPIDPSEMGCENEKLAGVSGKVCYCNTNLCNGNTNIAAAATTIVLLLAIPFFLAF